MRKNCIFMLVIALISFDTKAIAGENTLGLKEAISIALENNHALQALKNSLSAQHEDIGIARSYLLPKINFEERFLRTTNPTYAFMVKLNQERFEQPDFAWSSLNNPNAINDSGVVVGNGFDGTMQKGFVYRNGEYTELFPPWSIGPSVTSINNSGVVVGWGADIEGKDRAFIAVPKF